MYPGLLMCCKSKEAFTPVIQVAVVQQEPQPCDLRTKNHKVAMVGDCINDAPALVEQPSEYQLCCWRGAPCPCKLRSSINRRAKAKARVIEV